MRFKFKEKSFLVIATIIVLFASISILTSYIAISSLVEQNTSSKINSVQRMGLSYIDEKYKGPWRVEGDKLFKGDKEINNSYELVDKIKKDSNLEITIFQGDTRVVTTIIKNGKRAVGTKANKDVIQTTLNNGQDYQGETTILNSKFDVQYTPLRDAKGKVIGMFFVGLQKQVLINQTKSFIKTMVLITFGIIFVSLLIVLLFTKHFANPLGKLSSQLEIISRGNFSSTIPDVYKKRKDEIGDIAKSIEQMQKGLRTIIETLREEAPDQEESEETYLQGVIEPVNNNKNEAITSYGFINENITEIRVAKKKISDQLYFLRQLIDAVPNPMFYTGTDQCILGCNKAFEDAFRVERKNIIGKNTKEVDYLSGISNLQNGEEPLNPVRIKFADQKIHQVLYQKSQFKLSDSLLGGMISVMLDITELKEKEKALNQALLMAQEATQAKSMFLASMSHEIRTPMNAIIGMAYLALKTKLTAKQRDYISKIHNAGTSLLGIINDILDFSKIESGKLELEDARFNLEEIVSNAANIITPDAYNKGIEFLSYIHPNVPVNLVGDPLRLGQIIINLLSNAVKFTSQGEISIEIEKIYETGNRVQLQFKVRDTGIGMKKEEISRLFQAFTQADSSTTRKYGGTGLGLTISKKLVEMMGGSIWAESQYGQGSTFVFTAFFDISEASENPRVIPKHLNNIQLLLAEDNEIKKLENQNTVTHEIAGTKETILVVDDTPVNTMFLKDLLKEHYKIKIANNGEKAISLVRADPPDLILLDIMMPGIDGYETCRRLKAEPRYSDIPIIFLTARSDEEDESKGLELGAVDYIVKPINPLILFSRIKTQLLLKQARDFLKDNNHYLEAEVKRRTKEIELIQEVSIAAMASLAETRDSETGKHIQRTQLYVRELALELKNMAVYRDYLTDENILLIVKSTPLHDIGKVGIPDSILLKPGKLTKEEFSIMKTHTIIAKEAIQRAENFIGKSETFFKYAKEIAYYHHEKWDGNGYPEKISGNKIPLSARIMAVADVYDALVNKRVYKEAFSHEAAMKIIKEDSGKHFDPMVVQAFLKLEKTFNTISHTLRD